jgi:tRNA G26 N,N-dimethylase Trm1
MCKTIRSTCPNKNVLLNGIESLQKDYKVIPSYISPGVYKTNAPIKAIYDLIKTWKLKDLG